MKINRVIITLNIKFSSTNIINNANIFTFVMNEKESEAKITRANDY